MGVSFSFALSTKLNQRTITFLKKSPGITNEWAHISHTAERGDFFGNANFKTKLNHYKNSNSL